MLEFYEMTWGHIALNSVLIIVTYAWLIILTIFIMWRESKMGKRDFFITVFDPIIDIIFGLVGLVATHYYSTYIQANEKFGVWAICAAICFGVFLAKGFLKATTWHG